MVIYGMINFRLKNILWFSRFALFFDYFIFGIFKIFSGGPAEDLVEALHSKTVSFIPFETFIVVLGVSECLIGLAFLFPKLTKYIVPVMLGHMFTTFLPLILLPDLTWSNFPEPTLLGQYILKNVVLIALALNIYISSGRKQA